MRKIKGFVLSAALLGMLIIVPQGNAQQNPRECEFNCVMAASMAIRTCRGDRACMLQVRDDLRACLTACDVEGNCE